MDFSFDVVRTQAENGIPEGENTSSQDSLSHALAAASSSVPTDPLRLCRPCDSRLQGKSWDGKVTFAPVKTSVHKAEVMGVPVFLFRPDNAWFKGKQIYGGPTTEAYLYFSRAALVRGRGSSAGPPVPFSGETSER